MKIKYILRLTTITIIWLIIFSNSFAAHTNNPLSPILLNHEINAVWTKNTVKKGDTLKTIFARAGLNKKTYIKVLNLKKARSRLNFIKPAQVIYLLINNKHKLEKLIYPIGSFQYFEVFRSKDNFYTKLIRLNAEKKLKTASGIITRSLALSIRRYGLSKYLAAQLTYIFSNVINFRRNIHSGDKFQLLYEEYFLNNNKIKTGNIVAAKIINKGKLYQAVRYKAAHKKADYYTPQGKSLSFSLLRIPLNYTRITSFFNEKRMHPILKIIRPHKGVDFAAPIGTPIKAAGSGKIIFRGNNGDYGKLIIIKHNHKYETRYAHLLRFAKNIKAGSKVKKGKIIGYVGNSGLSTGPHLHYEIRVNGECRNPLKIKLPAAAPIPKKEMPAFLAYAKKMLNEL